MRYGSSHPSKASESQMISMSRVARLFAGPVAIQLLASCGNALHTTLDANPAGAEPVWALFPSVPTGCLSDANCRFGRGGSSLETSVKLYDDWTRKIPVGIYKKKYPAKYKVRHSFHRSRQSTVKRSTLIARVMSILNARPLTMRFWTVKVQLKRATVRSRL